MAGGIERDGRLTIVKVRDGFQDVAVGVERLRPTDSTGRVPVREQYDLCVDEVSGRDPSVQGLAESRGSRHVWGLFERTLFATDRIYTT